MTVLDDAIKEIKHDHKLYTRCGNLPKIEITEYILRTLVKQKVTPVLKEYYKENHCYDCGNDNQTGNYCGVCGKRLK